MKNIMEMYCLKIKTIELEIRVINIKLLNVLVPCPQSLLILIYIYY